MIFIVLSKVFFITIDLWLIFLVMTFFCHSRIGDKFVWCFKKAESRRLRKYLVSSDPSVVIKKLVLTQHFFLRRSFFCWENCSRAFPAEWEKRIWHSLDMRDQCRRTIDQHYFLGPTTLYAQFFQDFSKPEHSLRVQVKTIHEHWASQTKKLWASYWRLP